jgi:hypothetical protein
VPTLAPAVDPTLTAPMSLEVDTFALTAPVPLPPPPDSGDPDEPWVPVTTRPARRVQVLLHHVVTHEVIGELTTAVVEDYSEDVDLLAPGSATITASAHDPLWSQVALVTVTGPDGRPVYRWRPEYHEVSIGIDGVTRWVGVFRQPMDYDGDTLLLACREPSILFFDDTLGRVEQLDLYNGWGNFEKVPLGRTPPGLTVPPGVTATVVADAVRGTKSLQVTGNGWVSCPKVGLPGNVGNGPSAEGSAFGRFPRTMETGERTVITWARLGGSLVNPAVSLTKGGLRPDSGTRWTDDPVTSGALLSDDTVAVHQVWVDLLAHPDGVRYDLVRLQQGILTGFLNPQDGTRYPVRVLRDIQSTSLGGFPYGLSSRVDQLVGSDEFAMVWNHNGTHTVSDVLSACMDRVGGAEATIDPSWTLVVTKRLGRYRPELVLSNETVISPAWSDDPGAGAEDFVAMTGRGSGTSLVTSTVSQPRIANRHRRTKIVRGPNRTLNQIDAWAKVKAGVAARQQITAEVDVTWAYGEAIAKGDTLPTAMSVGSHGLWGQPVRVLTKTWLPFEGICRLTVGADDQ